jgi:hypothetical protein
MLDLGGATLLNPGLHAVDVIPQVRMRTKMGTTLSRHWALVSENSDELEVSKANANATCQHEVPALSNGATQ